MKERKKKKKKGAICNAKHWNSFIFNGGITCFAKKGINCFNCIISVKVKSVCLKTERKEISNLKIYTFYDIQPNNLLRNFSHSNFVTRVQRYKIVTVLHYNCDK